MNPSIKLLLSSALLLSVTVTASAATVQHHPFSEIFPPDQDLDFGENSAYNLSNFSIKSGITIKQNAVRDSGNKYDIIRLKDNGDVRVPNGDINMGGNNLKFLNLLKTSDSDGDGTRFEILEDSSGKYVIRNASSNNPRFTVEDTGNINIPAGDLDIGNGWLQFTGGGEEVVYLGLSGGGAGSIVTGSYTDDAGTSLGQYDWGLKARAAGESYNRALSAVFRDGGEVDFYNERGLKQLHISEGGDINIPNGNLDVKSNRIANVGAPQNDGDAVNKSYVDTSDDTIADDQNLTEVLSRGNSTGTYDIDMSGNNLTSSGGDICAGRFC